VLAGSRGGGSSSAPDLRRQPNAEHISETSLLGFLREFSEPRIFRLGEFGLAGDDDDGAVRFVLIAGDWDRGFARLLRDIGERRPARLAQLGRGFGRRDEQAIRQQRSDGRRKRDPQTKPVVQQDDIVIRRAGRDHDGMVIVIVNAHGDRIRGSKLWGPATLSGNEYRFGLDQSKVIDPRKGAWFDFATNEGGFIRDLMKKLNAAANHADTPPITYVNIAKWIKARVPQREWAVLNRIPAKNVTVLSGTGGIGKTILAMQLAAAAVLDREWFGVTPEQGPVIFVSGEEDEEEMHRRFADIVQDLDEFQDLINDGLHLIDKAGRNAMLACPGPDGVLVTTPFLKQLSTEASRIHPKLVILDNRNMVYGGNINDPTQVSSFINTMRGFAIDANTAVVLILHPSLAGMGAAADSSHQGLAGVMNWHDMPRGRIYFNRIKTDDDKEIDKDLRSLVCKKNNYGPDDENIIVRWRTGTNGSGVFVMEPKPGSLEAMAENKKVEEIFLSSLQHHTDQNRGPLCHKKRSNNYAPAVLADLPEVKKTGIKKTALASAMDRLIEMKKVTIQPYGPPSRDWTKLVIADVLAMDKLAAILTAWKAAIDTNAPRTLQYVIEMANPRINPELNAALLAVAAMDDGTTISNTLLTQWLQKHHRVPANGLMLSSDDSKEWTLIAPFLPTRAIREQLQQCGLNEDGIAKLTSLQQAQDIIRERLPQTNYADIPAHP